MWIRIQHPAYLPNRVGSSDRLAAKRCAKIVLSPRSRKRAMSVNPYSVLFGLALMITVLGADCPLDSHFRMNESCETTFFYDAYGVGINVPEHWPVASAGLLGGDNRIIGWYAPANTTNVLNPDLEIRSRKDFRTLEQIGNEMRVEDFEPPSTHNESKATTTLGGRPAWIVVRAFETWTVVTVYVKAGSTLYSASMVGKDEYDTNDREFLVSTCRSICVGVDEG